jgi:hypothetical protein
VAWHEHLFLKTLAAPCGAQSRGETSDLTPLVSPRFNRPERLPLCEFRSVYRFEEFTMGPPERQRESELEQPAWTV